MSSEALRSALLELSWSVFTELGVPGVVRHHANLAVDPEPLVAVVPVLFELDPRLRDQVYAWCASHGDRLSVSRLQGLVRDQPEVARRAFYALAATLREQHKLRWPHGDAASWSTVPVVKTRRLPVERPALLRFRARALCGVGARADVLAELLARTDAWTRASDLVGLGYSKRSIAGILAELAEGGLALQRGEGNALAFRLSQPEHLNESLGAEGLRFPVWRPIADALPLLVDLARLESSEPIVRRVDANRRREALVGLAHRLGVAPPPPTRGEPAAWEVLVGWAAQVAEALADGTSPACGRP